MKVLIHHMASRYYWTSDYRRKIGKDGKLKVRNIAPCLVKVEGKFLKFAEIGNTIPLYDNIFYGVPPNFFTTEEECVDSYKRQIEVHKSRLMKIIKSNEQELKEYQSLLGNIL